jgi:hypothetical protein
MQSLLKFMLEINCVYICVLLYLNVFVYAQVILVILFFFFRPMNKITGSNMINPSTSLFMITAHD